MYRSLDLLRIDEEEANLANRIRLFRLFVNCSFRDSLGGLLFIMIGLVVLIANFYAAEKCNTFIDYLLVWGFPACFFLGFPLIGFFWIRSKFQTALYGYIKKPQNYRFVRGVVKSAYYSYGGGARGNRKMVVKISSENNVHFTEEFSSWVWMFARKSEDRRLKEGDDWYDLKGQRPRMPFPAYLIQSELDPELISLVGLPSATVDPAIRLLRIRNRGAYLRYFLFILVLIGVWVALYYQDFNFK